MERSTEISDGGNACYITVNFNNPIHEETDMSRPRVSTKRTNKNAVSTTKKQKIDGRICETHSPDNTAFPSFFKKNDIEENFIFHQNNPHFFQMTNKLKGKVIIISNRFSGTKLERKGTKKDEERLRQTFEFLQGENTEIEVTSVPNLSARKIKEQLNLFADCKKVPSFYAIVIMSHGGGKPRPDGGLDDIIVGNDNTQVNVKEVVEIFNKDYLKKIPILMFFQMCRGTKRGRAEFKIPAVADFIGRNSDDDDVDDEDGGDNAGSELVQSYRKLLRELLPDASFIGYVPEDEDDQIDAALEAFSEDDEIDQPTHEHVSKTSSEDDEIDDPALVHVKETENMMVSFSTTEDFVSIKNPGKGSWFIQTLCTEIKNRAHNEDIVAIMKEVHYVVHGKKSRTKKLEKCIIACDTAYKFGGKKLFFFPGLPK